MNTLNYLRQIHESQYEIGDNWMDIALSQTLYDEWAQGLFQCGLATVRYANSMWPLIHWYRSLENSYWALRRLTLAHTEKPYTEEEARADFPAYFRELAK